MILVDNLLDVIEKEIPRIQEEKPGLKDSLQKAILTDKFHFIKSKDDKKEIGFLSWRENIEDNQLHITIENLFILKEYRGEFNLCKLREWFREMYPNALFNWRSRKRGTYVFAK